MYALYIQQQMGQDHFRFGSARGRGNKEESSKVSKGSQRILDIAAELMSEPFFSAR